MEQSITFRELDKHEIGMAMELAWEVFMQFEAAGSVRLREHVRSAGR